MSTDVASGEIQIGHHVEVELFGLTFNADTIWSTVLAGAVVLGLGFWCRSTITSGVPSRLQVIWETLVGTINEQVEANIGRIHPFVAPLALSLFTFILVCNWFELIPSGEDPHLLPAPTADVNLTYALALLVVVTMHVYSVRKRGVKNYVKSYFQPYAVLFPLRLIEEIVKPFTLALRLFGNIFAGGIMLSLIGLIPLYIMWGPNILWKAFDLFIGLIQAFIFALLTILYFAEGGASHEVEDEPTKGGARDTGERDEQERERDEQGDREPAAAAAQ